MGTRTKKIIITPFRLWCPLIKISQIDAAPQTADWKQLVTFCLQSVVVGWRVGFVAMWRNRKADVVQGISAFYR